MSSLFRKQVYTAKLRKSDALGGVGATMPIGWGIITAIIFAFVLGLIVFLYLAEFARKESARGSLRYAGAEARILPETSGIIASCLADNGDRVTEGQTLATVTTETYLQDGPAISEDEIAAIEDEINNLEARLNGADERARIERNLIAAELSGAAHLLEQKNQQLGISQNRLTTALERRAEAERDLEEGLLTKGVVHARIDDVANMQQAALRTEIEISDLASTIKTKRIRLQQIDAELAEEKAILQQAITQKRASLSRQTALKGYALKATIAGIVTASVCRTGEPVEPNAPLMTVLPTDSYLIGELFLPTSAIALIEEGQIVSIRYDALPYQKFGVFEGAISDISRVTFDPDNLSDGPVYRVVVTLDQQTIEAGSNNIELQSGMQFNADIVLEKRRAINWLIDPVRR